MKKYLLIIPAIFIVIFSTAHAAFLAVPTGTAAGYTAVVSSQFSDQGTLNLVALCVGVPLFFVIIDLLIGLFSFQRETDKEFKRIMEKYK